MYHPSSTARVTHRNSSPRLNDSSSASVAEYVYKATTLQPSRSGGPRLEPRCVDGGGASGCGALPVNIRFRASAAGDLPRSGCARELGVSPALAVAAASVRSTSFSYRAWFRRVPSLAACGAWGTLAVMSDSFSACCTSERCRRSSSSCCCRRSCSSASASRTSESRMSNTFVFRIVVICPAISAGCRYGTPRRSNGRYARSRTSSSLCVTRSRSIATSASSSLHHATSLSRSDACRFASGSSESALSSSSRSCCPALSRARSSWCSLRSTRRAALR
mmetsp:Transcript_47033/g.145011  ORF Transcript_47033/g.145011 Transcript_47033/m.145011 type:complete len:277 (-) Transcript_47033:1357-2187(-)